MSEKGKGFWFRFICSAGLAGLLVGCATGNVKFGDTKSDKGDMSAYKTVAITVINDIGEDCPLDVPENLQAAAIAQMNSKYPGKFEDVRPAPAGVENELLAEVHIIKYKKGSRFARAMLIGLGASKISTTVNMMDSPTKTLLNSGNLDLTWAIGGAMGASKGIEDLVDDAGSKIAGAIVAFKDGTEQVASDADTSRKRM